MALLALEATDILHAHGVHLAGFDIVVEFLVNAIELIALSAVVIELDLCLAVAVNAPAHAQISKLVYFIHFGDLAMAGLALYFTCFYVL